MLMLSTFAPLSTAYLMPLATTSSVPMNGLPKTKSQNVAMTLTGMIRTLNAMPAAPTPLFVS